MELSLSPTAESEGEQSPCYSEVEDYSTMEVERDFHLSSDHRLIPDATPASARTDGNNEQSRDHHHHIDDEHDDDGEKIDVEEVEYWTKKEENQTEDTPSLSQPPLPIDLSADCEPETVEIRESPYDKDNDDFEGKEPMFQKFEALMIPDHSTDTSRRRRGVRPTAEAIERIGSQEDATDMLRMYLAIQKSIIVYSNSWMQEGVVEDTKLKPIPKNRMILCLQSNSISHATPQSVNLIVQDMDVYKMVLEGMEFWNFKDEFPDLFTVLQTFVEGLSTLPPGLFDASTRKRCQLCSIFVARSFECAKLLRRKFLDPTLEEKIEACLSIVAMHAPDVSTLNAGAKTRSINSKVSSEKENENKTVALNAAASNGAEDDDEAQKILRQPVAPKTAASNGADDEHEAQKSSSKPVASGAAVRNGAVDDDETQKNSRKRRRLNEPVDMANQTNDPPAPQRSRFRLLSSQLEFPNKKIEFCSREGRTIHTFDDVRDVSLATEMSYDRILEKINQGMVPHNPYFFRYAAVPVHRPRPLVDLSRRRANDESMSEKSPSGSALSELHNASNVPRSVSIESDKQIEKDLTLNESERNTVSTTSTPARKPNAKPKEVAVQPPDVSEESISDNQPKSSLKSTKKARQPAPRTLEIVETPPPPRRKKAPPITAAGETEPSSPKKFHWNNWLSSPLKGDPVPQMTLKKQNNGDGKSRPRPPWKSTTSRHPDSAPMSCVPSKTSPAKPHDTNRTGSHTTPNTAPPDKTACVEKCPVVVRCEEMDTIIHRYDSIDDIVDVGIRSELRSKLVVPRRECRINGYIWSYAGKNAARNIEKSSG